MTNLISKHILTEKDVHFMSETERLYRNEMTIVYAKKKNDQYYIENNDNDDEDQNFESQNFESQNFESENQNFESENEIFDQEKINLEEINQEFFQEENQLIVYQQKSAVLYAQTLRNEIIQNLKQSIDNVKLLKSMINLLIKTSKINQSSTIIEIKSESDSASKIKQISSSFSNMKVKKIEKNNQKIFHQSKFKENLQFNQIELNATLKTSATHDAHAQAFIQKIQSATSTQKIQSTTFTQKIQSAITTLKIQSTIDETNIISQKMNRIKRIKKVVHSMTLKQVKAARNYYFKESTNDSQRIQKETKDVFLKNHKNDISLESTNYKHSHFSKLKQII